MSNKQLRKIYTVLAVGMLVSFWGCGKKSSENTIVLKVGNETLTLSDVREQLKNTPLSYQEYLNTEPGRQQFFDLLTRQKLIIAVARKNKVDKRTDIIQAVKEFKKDYMNKVKQYEEELLMQEYLKEIESKELKVTDEDINNYYTEHKKELQNPKEYSLSHILLGSEKEAQDVINKIRAGGDFEKLAKDLSLDPASNTKGGELGKFKFYELLPEFLSPVESARVGGLVPGPVSTVYGYHVLKKTAERILASKSFEDLKTDIKKIIIKKKFDKWIEAQKKKFKIEKYNSALSLLWK